ncbi:MAG: PPC domain-containing protein [Treponema sp.]|jgi:hypothetical protein|nr:PPC domain-containing protein [Treponema sp.]
MKRFLPVFVFFFALSALYGQDSTDTLVRLDSEVKKLAVQLQKAIPVQARNLVPGQWSYGEAVPELGSFWAAQLIEELVNIPGRTFALLPAGANDAEWTVSGEIIDTGGAIRVYTRLLRNSDYSIQGSFHADLPLDEKLAEMLAGGENDRPPPVVRDRYENDGWENPLAVEIAPDEGISVLNRTLHTSNDEDFFVLVPEKDGFLIAETTGDTDTYMEFFRADSREKLASNDDGSSGTNARIRYNVRAGSRYIVKVSGYEGDRGSYGFRVSFSGETHTAPDEYEDDNDFSSARDIAVGSSRQHTFTNGDDTDWLKFQIDQPGRYVIRAGGVSSNELDTIIELYDSHRNLIDEDDDGSEGYSSRLSVELQSGTYYLQVKCLDDEPSQPYTVRVSAE